ncbi:serine hydrolase [Algivirga pacifica]|uniref:Glycoside hydrolase family 3 N-terminal domain-containing protein n=1 Tax=Algivirga pacifica TaxID=1162670 RepID=A0ABP9DAA4_9BACT
MTLGRYPVYLILIACIGISSRIAAQESSSAWVDTTLANMSLEEKIAQLLIVPIQTGQDAQTFRVERLIEKYGVGGVVFQDIENVHTDSIHLLQNKSTIPLFIGLDPIKGILNRKHKPFNYPKSITLGAIGSNQAIYQLGEAIAEEHQELLINFSTINLDNNIHKDNPHTTWGDIKELIVSKGSAFIRGIQRRNVAGCLKYFPKSTSNPFSAEHQDKLFIYRNLIADSISLLMSEYTIKDLQSKQGQTTIPLVAGHHNPLQFLRDSANYEGLFMANLTSLNPLVQYQYAGSSAIQTLKDGFNMVITPYDIPRVIFDIKQAINVGQLSESVIDQSVRKILLVKEKKIIALPERSPIYYTENQKEALVQQIYEQSTTVIHAQDSILPFLKVNQQKVAVISLGNDDPKNPFYQYTQHYIEAEHFPLSTQNISTAAVNDLYNKTKTFNAVIVGIFTDSNSPIDRYGVSYASVQLLKKLRASNTRVITVLFGSPMGLQYLDFCDNLICAYETSPIAQRVVPQIIFGAVESTGRLPINISTTIKGGVGIQTNSLQRISYGLPEMSGMDSEYLKKVDSLIEQSIIQEAFPGCQIVAIHHGRMVFNKAYGHLTYSKNKAITTETLYDIASVTKVAATVQGLMYLTSKNKFNIYNNLGYYLPSLRGTDKSSLRIKNILTHCSALKGGYFFWGHVMDINTRLFNDNYLVDKAKEGYNVQVSPNLFANDSIKDYMWDWLKESSLSRRRRYRGGRYSYRYSDLGYYFFQRIIEKQTGQPLDQFLEDSIYAPMGLRSLGYLPYLRKKGRDIAPTELDFRYRQELVTDGFVHDPSAALMGGVAGHAGLFSTAHDLGILMQMNLQNGRYGGKEFFTEKTLNTFNNRPYKMYRNRRGYGWDKPNPWKKSESPTSPKASTYTFGHTGYTGTCAWADPKNELVYVFLCNRVYPYANNRTLIDLDLRSEIQGIFYEAIEEVESLNR